MGRDGQLPRVIRLTPRFLTRRAACGVVSGTPASEAVGATVAALAVAETLPGRLDVRQMMPPTQDAFVRRVAGHNLWLWYDATDSEVVLLTMTRVPPPR